MSDNNQNNKSFSYNLINDKKRKRETANLKGSFLFSIIYLSKMKFLKLLNNRIDKSKSNWYKRKYFK